MVRCLKLHNVIFICELCNCRLAFYLIWTCIDWHIFKQLQDVCLVLSIGVVSADFYYNWNKGINVKPIC